MEKAILRIGARSEVLLEDMREFLDAIETMYNSFVKLEYLATGEITEVREVYGLGPTNIPLAIELTPLVSKDKLVLKSVQIGSEGILELIANLNPAKVIREIISDLLNFIVELKKLRIEQERIHRELELKEREQTLKERITEFTMEFIMRAGIYREEDINRVIDRWIMKPSNQVVYSIKKGIITGDIDLAPVSPNSQAVAV